VRTALTITMSFMEGPPTQNTINTKAQRHEGTKKAAINNF
jgi:hypothetical protein